jgi:hypothetical protein
VPLTGRPKHVHFRSDDELAAIHRSPADLCNAQLHYTTLIHLGRAWDIRAAPLTVESFTEAITRLSAATDVADELLQRATCPGKYDAWEESPTARQAWRRAHGYPLQPLRDYRNRLLHGRIPPNITIELHGPLPDEVLYVPSNEPRQFLAVPRIGREKAHLDWRTVIGQPDDRLTALRVDADFALAQNVFGTAWREVVAYLQNQWLGTLIPALLE